MGVGWLWDGHHRVPVDANPNDATEYNIYLAGFL